MDSKHVLAKRVGLFSSATLISRILGYIRDASVAYVFGGGMLTDSFYTAFRVSNLFRRLLGEGALSSSFVPVFTQSLKTEAPKKTQDFLNSLFTSLICILAIMTSLGILFTPQLMKLIAPGFSEDPQKFQITVTLTRWMFPFFLFISLAALVTGVLNSLKHFFLPAVAPAMLSVAEITYLLGIIPLLLFTLKSFSIETQMIGLAISAVVGGMGHFIVQIPSILKENFSLKWSWNWKHPQSIQVVKLMIPAIVGLSVDQIDAFIDTICATYLIEGSVTALYNSNRLMQLPLALFGIAIASVSLSTLSDHSAEKDFQKFSETINSSLRLMIFTVLPSSIGLIVLSYPVCALLFQHGKFTAIQTQLTAGTLSAYSIGLIAYSTVKVLANSFYALQMPKIPVRIAVSCMLFHIVLNLILMKPLGASGLALATSLTSILNATWLFILLRKEIKKHLHDSTKNIDFHLGTFLIKTFFSGTVMFIYLILILKWGAQWNVPVQVTVSILGGILLYFSMAKLLKIEEQQTLLKILLRK